MVCPKIELNVSEENEIGFKLKIEGSANDIGSATPRIRFALTEKATGKGWLFNTTKSEDDGIAVTIPAMKGMVNENQDYAGKLEVILGEHYFTPTEMDINFIEPLKVEASFVTNKGGSKAKPISEETEKEISQELVIESQIASVIKKPVEKEQPVEAEEQMIVDKPVPRTPVVVKEEIKKKVSYAELSVDDKKKVNDIFVEKCKKIDPENFRNKEDVAHYMKEGTDYTKKRMSALMAQSIKQFLEKNQ